MFFLRLMLFIGLLVAGVLLIKYRERMTRMIGKNDLAEKYLGAGGTYNMWVLIGALAMVVGTMILLGKCAIAGL